MKQCYSRSGMGVHLFSHAAAGFWGHFAIKIKLLMSGTIGRTWPEALFPPGRVAYHGGRIVKDARRMSNRSLVKFLGTSPWFGTVSEDERTRVVAEIVEKQLATGSYLCHELERPGHWYGVVDGLLKVCTTGVDGESTTFLGVPTGGWFGEGTILKREPRKYDVVALRDSTVVCMPAETFLRLYERSLAFNHFVIAQLNERLEQFISLYAAHRSQTVNEQVARSLTWLFNDRLYPGAETHLKISQEEIANLAGVSRPRCNRALKRLKDAGLIHIGYGAITILDLQGLRTFAD